MHALHRLLLVLLNVLVQLRQHLLDLQHAVHTDSVVCFASGVHDREPKADSETYDARK
jgi:hypothetical protein